MRAWVAVVVSCIVGSCPVWAIEGRYAVEGRNPGQSQVYRGEAVIKRTGDTFSVVWQIGTGRQIGTGIRSGPVLSIVFQGVGGGGGGVASFEIVGDKVTGGRWAVTGGQLTGTETWTARGEL